MSPVRNKRSAKTPIPLEDTRQRILRAARIELAARGFSAASTNAIAEAAGVAKGLVFHHFTSKTELCLAVVDQVTEEIVRSYLEAPEPWPDDLFERLHAISMHKVKMFQRDPESYNVIAMMAEAPPDLREAIFARAVQVRQRVWPILLRGVSTRRLRKGLTLDDALETIVVLGEGLERQIVARIRELPDRGASQMNVILRDAWKHYERLRDGLYR
jgi:TetR/AcrR family transcriptional regulator